MASRPGWLPACSLEERESLADHLRLCAECQDALQALEATVALVRGLPAIEAPLDVQTRVLGLGWRRAAEDLNAPVLARASRPASERAPAASMHDVRTASAAPMADRASPVPRSDLAERGVLYWIFVAAGILALLVLATVLLK